MLGKNTLKTIVINVFKEREKETDRLPENHALPCRGERQIEGHQIN